MSIVSPEFMSAVQDSAHWIALVMVAGIVGYLIGRFDLQFHRDVAKLAKARRDCRIAARSPEDAARSVP